MKVKANGIHINYRIDGPEGAPWITMSNSLVTTHRMWDPQIDALTKRFRVLRYDQRGHGETDVPAGPYSLEILADDVLALLDALSIGHTHFLGLSLGGMTGMTVAMRRQSALRSLVLSGTASQDPLGLPQWEGLIEAVRRAGTMEVLVERYLDRFLTSDTVTMRPDLADTVRTMVQDTSLEGYIACCQAISHFDVTDRLSEITVPVLVVVGTDDRGTPLEMAEGIHGHVAGAELVVLNNAAHLANLDQADAFNEAVVSFLERH